MPLRLVEIILPPHLVEKLAQYPNQQALIGRWDDPLDSERLLIRILVESERAEELLDFLDSRFAQASEYRVMLIPVEATLPRPPEDKAKKQTPEKPPPQRINREELYNDVTRGAKLTRTFVAQVVLATLVAAVGLKRNDTALLIGAMVIAPLLGPNVSLCLATILGDKKLALRSLQANAVGMTVALIGAILIGWSFPIDMTVPAIHSRTQVSGGDIILALSAGCAGVLAFTTGAPSALIGVMVAVAILPPFAVFGLLLASGEFVGAGRALLLVATNVICVNLAGVLTFFVQGVRPRSWWEAEKAKRATRVAIGIWASLFIALIVLIFVASRFD